MRINRPIHFARLASFVTGLMGLIVLFGWIFGKIAFESIASVFISFKFITGLCFLLSAVSLFVLDKEKAKKYELVIAHISLSLALILSGISLTEYLLNRNAGIAELLVKFNLATDQFQGRMRFVTSILFVLLNLSFLLLRRKRFHLYAHILLITGMIILCANFIMYAARLPYTTSYNHCRCHKFHGIIFGHVWWHLF